MIPHHLYYQLVIVGLLWLCVMLHSVWSSPDAVSPQPPVQPVPPQMKRKRVVFQKWRWTGINVTLGLIFIASLRKEWPMTFIAVRCPHGQSDQIVKRGKTARGTQRYLCQNTLCAKG